MMLDRRRLLGLSALSGAGATLGGLSSARSATLNDGLTGDLQGIHDPVLINEKGVYHVFGSGGWWGKPGPSWRTSRDLASWTDNGSPFAATPEWARKAIREDATMWAPDIALVDGRYRLHYSVSTGGSMRSVTGYATTKTLDRRSPDYGWTDRGLVIESFPGGDHNVIDANFVVDAEGDHWLAFGSFWSGLKLVGSTAAPASGRAAPNFIRSPIARRRRAATTRSKAPSSSSAADGITCSPATTIAARRTRATIMSRSAARARSPAPIAARTARR